MYSIKITKHYVNGESQEQGTRTGFKTEKAAKRELKKLDKLYPFGRFTFYNFEIIECN